MRESRGLFGATMQGFINTEGWGETLAIFGATDIYFSYAYHRLCSPGTPRCFLYKEAQHAFCLPIIESTIPGTEFTDFSTCYGYSGPLSTTEDPVFINNAWTQFMECCAAEGMIAGFIRFHPLLNNIRFAAGEKVRTRFDRKTVFIDLTVPSEQIWNSKINANHYWLRRAKREGATFFADEGGRYFPQFVSLYRATMERHQASTEYRFDDRYFDELRKLLSDNGFLACITIGDRLIAAAVILCSSPLAHYHLGGSDAEFRQLCPNALLFVEAAHHLKSRGFSRFHLGGGSDAQEDNSLLNFKQRLSRHVADFYTGSVLINPERYRALCEGWERSATPATIARYGAYTLKYRYSL